MKDYLNNSVNANQINGHTTLTGKLYFYDDGFVFKAQGVNSIINSSKIAYQDIAYVKSRNTLGLIPNGITVCLKNSKVYNYVVIPRRGVLEFMIKMKNQFEQRGE